MTDAGASRRTGLLLGLGAYTMWGVLPLYFKALTHAPAGQIVAHRIVWSLFLLGLLASLLRRWPAIRAALAAPRVLAVLALTATLIAINWLIYIYAVLSGNVLAGSLGYYLNPLVNVVLGVVILKERLTRVQGLSVLLAASGVLILAWGAGSGLWISLTLAGSFALYGFLRKVAPVESLEGLSIETLLLTPIAIGYLWWVSAQGTGLFGTHSRLTDVLLILGGVITAVPLLLFTAAAKRLPYSTLGFLQYIAPTLQFLLAVLAFGEPLTTPHLIAFGLIWTALAIFSVAGLQAAHAARVRAAAAEGLV